MADTGCQKLKLALQDCKTDEEKMWVRSKWVVDKKLKLFELTEEHTKEVEKDARTLQGWMTDFQVAAELKLDMKDEQHMKLLHIKLSKAPTRDHEDEDWAKEGVKQYWFDEQMATEIHDRERHGQTIKSGPVKIKEKTVQALQKGPEEEQIKTGDIVFLEMPFLRVRCARNQRFCQNKPGVKYYLERNVSETGGSF